MCFWFVSVFVSVSVSVSVCILYCFHVVYFVSSFLVLSFWLLRSCSCHEFCWAVTVLKRRWLHMTGRKEGELERFLDWCHAKKAPAVQGFVA